MKKLLHILILALAFKQRLLIITAVHQAAEADQARGFGVFFDLIQPLSDVQGLRMTMVPGARQRDFGQKPFQ